MSDLVFRGGTLVLPDDVLPGGAVLVEEGRIAAVGPAEEIPLPEGAEVVDLLDGFLAPGFVELHTHGAAGHDVMDGTAEAVLEVGRAHLRHGTTTFFPTTSTGSPGVIRRMVDACAAARDGWRPGPDGARIAGVHLYGPYFAEEKVGCHPREGRRDPDPAEYEELLSLGAVGIATCAAELPGAEDFYRAAAERGCLVTCGHSDASWEEMERAFAAGMRHVDHFWCAMSSIQSVRERFGFPMRGSMAEFVLANEEMSTEVIADLEHLAPELLLTAYRLKGQRRLCLVTDASRGMDMPAGEYLFGPPGEGVVIWSDGRVGRAGPEGTLASSVTGMDRMVQNMLGATGAPLADVIRMASLTPAERAGIDGELGSIEEGKLADLLVLAGDLSVRRVFVEGVETALSGRPGA